jgi:D-tagatose-1,6-bisphosphate aldolase subunit GatZ/KbaZ
MKARDIFLNTLSSNRNGEKKGVYSICSAHPIVLKTAMIHAKKCDSIVLIESTSNQVDQFGGYTGMKPKDFVKFVHDIADETGFDKDKIMLGGDHLGPNAWQGEKSSDAMAKARDLIREYILAGYEKIHLDASMFCADDSGDRHKPLDDSIVAERTSDLCKVAEETYLKSGSESNKPVYIIGTEVPIPGGAKEKEDGVNVTDVESVNKTIETNRQSFMKNGLDDAWERVVGVVVQPGVEFGDDQIIDYKREKAVSLKNNILSHANLVYEAHSTDYQSEINLTRLTEDHFCIQKVGPWLTFAYREAVFALADIEKELLGNKKGITLSNLKEVLDATMVGNDIYWKKYYGGDTEQQGFARKYSLSDRSRYYWSDSKVKESVLRLMSNLSGTQIPVALLSQYLPDQYYAIRENRIQNSVESIVIDRVQTVMSIYSRACGIL